jgi:hypothetical protein
MASANDFINAVNDSKVERVNYMVNPVGYGVLGWKLINTSAAPAEEIARFPRKEEAVAYARTYMWDLWYKGSQLTELSICNRLGRVAEKNTYPRDSDPPTKG